MAAFNRSDKRLPPSPGFNQAYILQPAFSPLPLSILKAKRATRELHSLLP
jgi:hypothetical protein